MALLHTRIMFPTRIFIVPLWPLWCFLIGRAVLVNNSQEVLDANTLAPTLTLSINDGVKVKSRSL